MVKRILSLLSVLLLAMVVLAACGGDDEDDDQTRVPVSNAPSPPATTAPTAAASPKASPGASPAASPHASPKASPKASPMASPGASPVAAAPNPPPPPPSELTVDLEDIKFNPTTLTIPANTDVKVKVVNTGAIPHTFTISALGVDTGSVDPGETTEVTIKAAPGTYEYDCTEPGHKQAGMVGTLTVQ
jgi:plastocyanin